MRLIPARAGKTRLPRHPLTQPRAHPRACGENTAASIASPAIGGSSPRVRGKPGRGGLSGALVRLIPARAGKTTHYVLFTQYRWAHPRACGENEGALRDALARRGSSPRVRGKLPRRRGAAAPHRLIPACAGKTPPSPRRSASPGAHPRVCGENSIGEGRSLLDEGSSPRVRGKPIKPSPPPWGRRLIPACAGKTCRRAVSMTAPRAHPRVCGENLSRPRGWGKSPGSSPRVRGKQEGAHSGRVTAGLIPACAGKTSPRARRAVAGRAHPRVCGENSMGRDVRLPSRGSSPRVRGKLDLAPDLPEEPRLIPACAGKTPRTPKP